ncbi:MAG: RDD family protein [Chromatiales bacterium]|nr:RDD family protein [Chromatiales bacterium]
MNAGRPDRPYVGFWNRTAAALIDSALLLVVTLPLQQLLTGAALDLPGGSPTGFWDVMVGYVLPAIAILVFWKYRSATPGKMFMSAEIVDAATGGKPSSRQLVVRYVGYYVSTLPLLLGLVWVAFDPKKQGWHDKLAGTVVVSTAVTASPGRYAPTSPLTYLICAPILLLLLALMIVAFAVGIDPGSLRTGNPLLG